MPGALASGDGAAAAVRRHGEFHHGRGPAALEGAASCAGIDCRFVWRQSRLSRLRGLPRPLPLRQAQESAPRTPPRCGSGHTRNIGYERGTTASLWRTIFALGAHLPPPRNAHYLSGRVLELVAGACPGRSWSSSPNARGEPARLPRSFRAAVALCVTGGAQAEDCLHFEACYSGRSSTATGARASRVPIPARRESTS